MEDFWNSSNLLKVILKWKWHIIIISLIGTAIIGASTYLIEPKFNSYAIVYPENLGEFSEESYSEQMIQLLKSREITDKVIERFNLSGHYEIDRSYKHYQSTMYYLYNQNVSIRKTEYESVEIDVLDTDSQIAKDIVISILEFYNRKVRELHQVKLKERIVVNENQVKHFRQVKDSLELLIRNSGNKFEVADDYFQTKETSKKLNNKKNAQYTIKSQRISSKSKQFKRLDRQGPEYFFVSSMYGDVSELLLKFEYDVKVDKVEYDKVISYFAMVTEPYVSDKKYSPKRITITLLGGMSLFILIILIIGFIENKKHNI